jgi:hypothetical protein
MEKMKDGEYGHGCMTTEPAKILFRRGWRRGVGEAHQGTL